MTYGPNGLVQREAYRQKTVRARLATRFSCLHNGPLCSPLHRPKARESAPAERHRPARSFSRSRGGERGQPLSQEEDPLPTGSVSPSPPDTQEFAKLGTFSSSPLSTLRTCVVDDPTRRRPPLLHIHSSSSDRSVIGEPSPQASARASTYTAMRDCSSLSVSRRPAQGDSKVDAQAALDPERATPRFQSEAHSLDAHSRRQI